jgi:uncharacterized protein YbjQ (UPF0145 family)
MAYGIEGRRVIEYIGVVSVYCSIIVSIIVRHDGRGSMPCKTYGIEGRRVIEYIGVVSVYMQYNCVYYCET